MANKRIIWSTQASKELIQILEYFNYQNNHIQIVSFWDNRQDTKRRQEI